MSMHLEGPWLSTTGKRKGKTKWRSAEHKRQAEQLDREWQDLKKRHAAEQENRKRERAMSAPVFTATQPYRRDTSAHIPSLNGGVDMAPALKSKEKVYTGNKIIGIGTMHKSNAVPIFSDSEAKEISSMRR
jgi:hypothetical protein